MVAGIFVVKKLIDDRIVGVLSRVLDFLGMLMKKFRPGQIGPAAKNIRYILDKMT